jgi:hypothetical protein
MALEYVAPDRRRAVVNVYRLAGSASAESFKLRGLDSSARYRILENGTSAGTRTGAELMSTGLAVSLPGEFRASVFEIERD